MYAENSIRIAAWSEVTPGVTPAPDGWFDANAHLGPRGHKYWSYATRYWLAACAPLARRPEADAAPSRFGIAVGTNFGAHRTLGELHAEAKAQGSSALSPMSAPNFCINLVASYAGIRHGAKRFNVTLTTPAVAGLDALALAARELRHGRCDVAFAGSAEEGWTAEQPVERLEGACAALLTRGTADSDGALCGEIELHRPPQMDDNGERRLAAWLAKRLRDSMMPAPMVLHICSDTPDALEAAARLFDHADFRPTQRYAYCLPAAHGCLEPVLALRAAIAGGARGFFFYAGSGGALRGFAYSGSAA
jgi:3-oxoacyl-[acyl-carrier-protein] synthase II